MSKEAAFPGSFLDEAGLNRQHVFDLDSLPAAVLAALDVQAGERQLILIGHGGRRLWERLQATGMAGSDPIDDYSTRTIRQWFARELPDHRFRIPFPGARPIGLQALGALAGWHQPSPLMIGVDAEWGSWYAYRAVVIADTDFAPSPRHVGYSPCATCHPAPCISTCPAHALTGGQFDLAACSHHRLIPDSPCAMGCLARQACPAGSEHRYDDAQIRHSYGRSLAVIRQYYATEPPTPERQ